MQTILRYGIQKAAENEADPQKLKKTVGEQIKYLLEQEKEGPATAQILEALKSPQSIIEVRAGAVVQTVSPDMPLRELLPVDGDELEIAVSQPHVGG